MDPPGIYEMILLDPDISTIISSQGFFVSGRTRLAKDTRHRRERRGPDDGTGHPPLQRQDDMNRAGTEGRLFFLTRVSCYETRGRGR